MKLLVMNRSRISPITLVYISDLPNCVERSTVRMLADDTTLTAHGRSVAEIESVLNHDLNNVKE